MSDLLHSIMANPRAAEREIEHLRKRVKELEGRTMKEAFQAGHLAGQMGKSSIKAYRAWRNSE